MQKNPKFSENRKVILAIVTPSSKQIIETDLWTLNTTTKYISLIYGPRAEILIFDELRRNTQSVRFLLGA